MNNLWKFYGISTPGCLENISDIFGFEGVERVLEDCTGIMHIIRLESSEFKLTLESKCKPTSREPVLTYLSRKKADKNERLSL